jgi:hypothetical protein
MVSNHEFSLCISNQFFVRFTSPTTSALIKITGEIPNMSTYSVINDIVLQIFLACAPVNQVRINLCINRPWTASALRLSPNCPYFVWMGSDYWYKNTSSIFELIYGEDPSIYHFLVTKENTGK